MKTRFTVCFIVASLLLRRAGAHAAAYLGDDGEGIVLGDVFGAGDDDGVNDPNAPVVGPGGGGNPPLPPGGGNPPLPPPPDPQPFPPLPPPDDDDAHPGGTGGLGPPAPESPEDPIPDDPGAPDPSDPDATGDPKPPQGPNPGGNNPEPSTADPIGTISGEVTTSATDLRVACPYIDLVFYRMYNSSSTSSSELGHGWTHSYDWELVPYDDGAWMVLRSMADVSLSGDRSAVYHAFKRLPDGTYTVSGNSMYLLNTVQGGFEVRTPGPLTYHFGSDGVLEKIVHKTGTSVALSHENRWNKASRRLSKVEHSNGKSLEFSYNDLTDTKVASVTVGPAELATVGVAFEYTNVVGGAYSLCNATRFSPGGSSSMAYVYAPQGAPASGFTEFKPRIATTYSPARQTAAASGLGSSISGVGTSSSIGISPPVEFSGGSSEPSAGKMVLKRDPNGVEAHFDYIKYSDAPGARACYSILDAGNHGGLFETSVEYYSGVTAIKEKVAGKERTTYLYYNPTSNWEYAKRVGATEEIRWHNFSGDVTRFVVHDTNTQAYAHSRTRFGTYHNATNWGSAYCSTPSNFWNQTWNLEWLAPQTVTSPEGRVSDWEIDGGDIVAYGAGRASALARVREVCSSNWIVQSVVNANGHSTAFERDGGGYIVKTIPSGRPWSAVGYDELGNPNRFETPGPDGAVRVSTSENNMFGLPLHAVAADGTEAFFECDGTGRNLVRSVDAMGRTNEYKWVLGLQVLARRFSDDFPQGVSLYTAGFDGMLNILSISDPLGRAAETYELDDNERVVSVTNLEGQTLRTSYAVAGIVDSVTRFDGTEVRYSYNPDGLVSEVSHPDGEITYGYDRDGLMVAASGVAGTVSNAYNEASWLSATRGVDGTEVVYGYHPAGQVSNVATVAGATGYALDAADRLSRIAAPSAAFDYAYNPWNGLVSAVTNGVGLVAEYQYDIMDRPTNIVWRAPGGGVLASFRYAYNPVGMITGRTVSMNGSGAVSTDYGYDGLDRLVAETESSGVVRTYAYDLAGNRLSKTQTGAGTTTYTLGIGDRLATYKGGSYTHDAAGCVTAIDRTGKPDLNLTWNGQYQLTSVSTNGVVAESYTYDPLGRRASTTSGGATVRHVYDGAHCVADLDAAGAVVRSYTWGPGIDNLLAVTCHSGSSSTTYYALTDIQGTVHGFADADGNLVARYTYDAWGNLLDSDVAVSGLADNRYLFQGREYSWATGLYNFRARWYDPATGRWLSKDPIGISGGLNLYAFCGDDPVNYVDPWGLCEKGSKWDQMAWWEKLGKGYYYGTGYGEDALQYYVDITLDPNAAWYQKGSAYVGGFLAALWTPETYQKVGGFLAALWTPETYQKTAWTLFSAYGMRDAGNLKFDGPSGTRRFQVRDRTTGEPHFRVDKGPVPGKDGPRFHYHRRPDLSKHRPYEGL